MLCSELLSCGCNVAEVFLCCAHRTCVVVCVTQLGFSQFGFPNLVFHIWFPQLGFPNLCFPIWFPQLGFSKLPPHGPCLVVRRICHKQTECVSRRQNMCRQNVCTASSTDKWWVHPFPEERGRRRTAPKPTSTQLCATTPRSR